jgi:hypothetical protein
MSRESELLIALLCRIWDPRAPLPDLHGLHWPSFLALAEAHAVTPMLCKALADAELPNIAAANLRSLREASVAASLAQSGELVRLAGLFAEHEIPVVALKGPLLSRYLYNDLGLRVSGDIDLLTRREHVVQIRGILLERGYRVKTTPHWKSSNACLRSRDNEMSFESPAGVSIDIHWRLIPPFFAGPCDRLDPWNNTQTVLLAGRPVNTLTPEALFLFLCSHGSKHMFERLGWVCDIGQFLVVTPHLNWPVVLRTARSASAAAADYSECPARRRFVQCAVAGRSAGGSASWCTEHGVGPSVDVRRPAACRSGGDQALFAETA